MIIETFAQGSPEWFSARAGIPTASNFDKIVTSTGAPSKSAQTYMYQLAGESLAGVKTETFKNAAMERGSEMEAEARQMLEIIYGKILQVGLCYYDDKKEFACSPDGLGDGISSQLGGYEIKCPLIHTHVKYLLEKRLPVEYVQQVQGSMLVTGLDQWIFCSYYPGLKPLILTIDRDAKFISLLKVELFNFLHRLDEITTELKER